MISRNKIIIFSVLGFVVLVAAALGVLFLLDRNENESAIDGGSLAEIGRSETFDLVVENNSSLGTLSDRVTVSGVGVSSPVIHFDSMSDSVVYFSAEDSSVYRITEEGERVQLFSFDDSLLTMSIAPNFSGAIVKTKDLENFYINISSGERIGLPDEIQNFAWSPDSTKIVYQYVNVFNRQNGLFVADPDATNFEQIYDFDSTEFLSQEVVLHWPLEDIVTFQYASSDLSGSLLVGVSVAEKKEKELNIDSLVGSHIFSSDGSVMLYDSLEYDPQTERNYLALSIYDLNSNESRRLNVETTASRCVLKSNEVVICSVPDDLFADNPREALVEYDINADTLKSFSISDAGSVQFTSLHYYPKTDTLYYIDGVSGEVRSAELSNL